ncbi:MAG: 2-ketoarginine methyltransferase, partial [Tumebacillaceae bacterium]
EPDFIVLCFILHEILGQEGVAGVERFLTRVVERFPNINIIVIEVDDRIDDPSIMQHGLSLAYYNPYYLLHYFTRQKLESKTYWEALFARCGLEILAEDTVDHEVESTNLELGYLIRRGGSR